MKSLMLCANVLFFRFIPFVWNIVTAGYLETSILGVSYFLPGERGPFEGECVKIIFVANTTHEFLFWKFNAMAELLGCATCMNAISMVLKFILLQQMRLDSVYKHLCNTWRNLCFYFVANDFLSIAHHDLHTSLLTLFLYIILITDCSWQWAYFPYLLLEGFWSHFGVQGSSSSSSFLLTSLLLQTPLSWPSSSTSLQDEKATCELWISLVCLMPAVLWVLLTKTCEDFFNLQMVNDLLIWYPSLCQYLLAKYLVIKIIMSIA